MGEADIGQIKLVDYRDNQEDGANNEALYVTNLTVNAGSSIDLNGLTLYYLNGESPDDFTGDGRVILNGGTLCQIPEPATLALLGFGLVGVVLRRRRR